jgi:hypothetical protein
VLGDEQGSQKRDKLLVRDVWKRVVVDDRLVIRVSWGEKNDRDEFSLSLNHLKTLGHGNTESITSLARKSGLDRQKKQRRPPSLRHIYPIETHRWAHSPA